MRFASGVYFLYLEESDFCLAARRDERDPALRVVADPGGLFEFVAVQSTSLWAALCMLAELRSG